jgi:hypothetical protein
LTGDDANADEPDTVGGGQLAAEAILLLEADALAMGLTGDGAPDGEAEGGGWLAGHLVNWH